MKKVAKILLVALLAMLLFSCSKTEETKAEYEPKDAVAKYYYVFGNYVASSYKQSYADIDLEAFAHGILSNVNNTFTYTEDDVLKIAQDYENYAREESAKLGKENLEKAEKFLAENKNKENVKVTESGLQYIVVKDSDGPKPEATDTVDVDYVLSDIDGNIIESTFNMGSSAAFPLQNVIEGFREGLTLMSIGSTYRLYIHPDLGYGNGYAGSIKPNSLLIFEVTLNSIN